MGNRIIAYSDSYHSSLMKFFNEVSPEITPEIWEEKYKKNPESGFGTISENILIDEKDNVAGHSAWHQIDISLNNKRFTGAWFLDWFVSPGQKGKGLGKALALDTIPEGTDLLMVARGTHDTIIRMEKWGFLNPVSSTSYLLPLTARTISRRKKLNAIGNAILYAAWFIVKNHFKKTARSLHADISVSIADSIHDIDMPANGALRTTKALNYFNSFSNSDIQIFNINKTNNTVAQIIINCSKDEFELDRVKILDFIIFDQSVDSATLSTAFNNIIYDMQKEKIDCIECLASSEDLAELLESHSFMNRGKAALYVKPLTPECEIELNKEGKWNFSFFDSDMFYR